MEMGELTQEAVALKVGKKRSTITNALRLLKLPEDIQRSLKDGQISAGHARAILSVSNPADQRILFGKIIGNSLSVHDAEDAAKILNNGGRAASKSPKKNVRKTLIFQRLSRSLSKFLEQKLYLRAILKKALFR